MQTSTTQTMGSKRWVSYGMMAAAALTLLVAIGAHRARPGRVIDFDEDPAGPSARSPQPVQVPVVKAPAHRPQVEVVFALDTTSSMSGLIEGAKQKIWSIASFIARGQPTPDLRVGLVAYRDLGDAYVTRVFDLDADLDRVYHHLRQFQAEGGGDTPEHVGRGLHDAVHRMSWSPVAKQDVLRLIYLVGDAPAHTDYNDGFDVMTAARDAEARGIQVHAIRCGDDESTAAQWRRVAMLGKGQFLSIGQDGGMHERHTPYDDELARLHDAVSDTVVAYGAKGGEARAALREAAAAPAPVKAARAEFLAKKRAAVAGDGDLVEGVASGKVSLASVPAADMPADLRALPAAEQKQKLNKLADDRKQLQARIEELISKRDKYVAAADRAEKELPAAKAEAMGAGVGTIGGGGRAYAVTGIAAPPPVAAPAATAAAAKPRASFDDEVAKTVSAGGKRIGVRY